MVAAEAIAELLAQVFLRVAAARVGGTRDTAGCGAVRCFAACSWPAVMKPSSRIRASTTWLRAIAPSRLDQGESADGARASPAISAHSASVSCFAGLPNRCRDIVSTP